jgi:FlaA1/EpsC-like NDP-sugar epimerase
MKRFIGKLANFIIYLPRTIKRFIVLFVDSVLCVLTVWLAYLLRVGEYMPMSTHTLFVVSVTIGIALPVFGFLGLYRNIFRYSGVPALITVANAVGIYAIVYMLFVTVIGIPGIPRTFGVIQPLLLLFFVGASRAVAYICLGDYYHQTTSQSNYPRRILIYGAGRNGRQLASALATSPEIKILGFVDDDHRLHDHEINRLPVYNPSKLETLVRSFNINSLLIAIPNISRQRINEIIRRFTNTSVEIRILPNLIDLIEGKISISDLREIDIDDLVGRETVLPNRTLMEINVLGKTVMITGAGGSIGSELCRQIIAIGPSKLLLVEHSEFALYSIHQELEESIAGRDILLVPLLASVHDMGSMENIFSIWKPTTVYHAAAYKHVPLVECNPVEGLKNNVLGTLLLAQIAEENGTLNFVMISTDKAVRPTNIMGASKRLAELILQALADANANTIFSMVRFGNVLGSSGSVVPKFREQIRSGGPITLTHPEITRFFMTSVEAAQLVIQAGAMAKGGEVFFLEMGKTVRIMDLALRMIELSGLRVKDEQNPDGDIEIQITGLRSGEKLFEELLIGENYITTSHNMIMKAHENFIPWVELAPHLKAFETALTMKDFDAIRFILKQLVAGYTPSYSVKNWI